MLFITKARHDAALAAKDAEIARLSRANYQLDLDKNSLDRTAKMYRRDLNEARAKIDRMTGGLIPGGPKAKAKRDAAAYPVPGSAADVSPPTHSVIS